MRVVPKKGALVRTLSHTEIRERYQQCEALALRLATPRLERTELEEFERRFRELRTRGRRLAYTEVRPLGEEFHRLLLKKSDNGKLVQTVEEIREQIQSVWTMSILAPRRVHALIREQLAIIEALKRGAAQRAETA